MLTLLAVIVGCTGFVRTTLASKEVMHDELVIAIKLYDLKNR